MTPAPLRSVPRATPRPQPWSWTGPDRQPRHHEITIRIGIGGGIASVITVPSRHAAMPATTPRGFLKALSGVRGTELRRCGRRHRLGVIDRSCRGKNGCDCQASEQNPTQASLPEMSLARASAWIYSRGSILPQRRAPSMFGAAQERKLLVRQCYFLPCSYPTTALALCRHEQESDSPETRWGAGNRAARGARGALSRLCAVDHHAPRAARRARRAEARASPHPLRHAAPAARSRHGVQEIGEDRRRRDGQFPPPWRPGDL